MTYWTDLYDTAAAAGFTDEANPADSVKSYIDTLIKGTADLKGQIRAHEANAISQQRDFDNLQRAFAEARRPKETEPLGIGDVVCLQSGSPDMTIIYVHQTQPPKVNCAWFGDSEFNQIEDVPTDALVYQGER